MNEKESEIKRHELYDVAIACNKNRSFSTFRTAEDFRIVVWPNYFKRIEKMPHVAILLGELTQTSSGLTIRREEKFYLFENGDLEILPEAKIPGIATTFEYSMEGMGGYRKHQYSNNQIFKQGFNLFDGEWKRGPTGIVIALDKIVNWLESEETLRVDPYDFDRVLPDEVIEYDREISRSVNWLHDQVENLHSV